MHGRQLSMKTELDAECALNLIRKQEIWKGSENAQYPLIWISMRCSDCSGGFQRNGWRVRVKLRIVPLERGSLVQVRIWPSTLWIIFTAIWICLGCVALVRCLYSVSTLALGIGMGVLFCGLIWQVLFFLESARRAERTLLRLFGGQLTSLSK